MQNFIKLPMFIAALYGITFSIQAQTIVLSQNFDSVALGAYGSLNNFDGGGNPSATIVVASAGGATNVTAANGNALELTGRAITIGATANFGVTTKNLPLTGNLSTSLADYTLSFDLAIGAADPGGYSIDVGTYNAAGTQGISYHPTVPAAGSGYTHFTINLSTLGVEFGTSRLSSTNSQMKVTLQVNGFPASASGTPNIFLDNLQITMTSASTGSTTNTATASVNAQILYQTIEGIGGAVAFYDGWVPAHPYKLEIYTNAFAGLNLSMLRLGNWYRYNDAVFNSASQSGEGWVAKDIVSNANRVLGHPVPVYMSSWSPPAFLKSTGQTGNGGTLIFTNGGFDYPDFAQYWYDSLQAYASNGVSPSWISIQNEPDFVASYDSCIFHPTEDTVNKTNYASYSKALDATYQWLKNMPSPPKLLGPEPVHIAYNDMQNYAATMNSNSFYGMNYHLYGNSANNPTPDGYISDLSSAANIFPIKPHFMTEYGYPDLIQTACLINNCFTVGQDSGFNYWSLIWPVGGNGLVQIENPYNLSSWTNAPAGVTTQSHGWWLTPAYWAVKHFSYFIQPGYRRISASNTDNNVRSSAYLASDGSRLVIVLINTNATAASAMTFNFGTFNVGNSSIYQTAGTNTYAGTNTFLSLGSLASPQMLPPLSITTVVLNQKPTSPCITRFQLLGNSFALAGTNDNAPGTYCNTLASTNLTLPLTNWIILATNQFGTGGRFNFTNLYDSSRGQQFFLLRVP